MKLTKEIWEVLDAVRAAGGRPLLVGGCVRDGLLGIDSKDIDIEVHGGLTLDALETPLKVLCRVDAVGKSFGVLKLTTRKGADLDVSVPRREVKVAEGHRGFTIEVDPTMSLREAAARRDFTINAIMWDPFTLERIDLFGGEKDLEDKILRHTSEAFSEDPLRVLRAVRFAGRFGLTIARSTADLCRSLLPTFSELPKERVWGEWERIITECQNFGASRKVLERTGWFAHFPGSQRIYGVDNVFRGRTDETLLTLAVFGSDVKSTEALFDAMGVPKTLREAALKLETAFQGLGIAPRRFTVCQLARRLAPLTVEQLATAFDLPEWAAEARKWGCLTGTVETLVTGDTLIGLGLKPGPDFARILRLTTEAQDAGEFDTTQGGIEWLTTSEK